MASAAAGVCYWMASLSRLPCRVGPNKTSVISVSFRVLGIRQPHARKEAALDLFLSGGGNHRPFVDVSCGRYHSIASDALSLVDKACQCFLAKSLDFLFDTLVAGALALTLIVRTGCSAAPYA